MINRVLIGQLFPPISQVRYSVVSGFIFLRFFAPAILGPKLFDLTTEPLVSLICLFNARAQDVSPKFWEIFLAPTLIAHCVYAHE
jgi:GTPase-activator protein for Ras-like GTPase